ncbi:MAG: FAD-binding oxidoreductase [Sphingobacteriales bacterium]|nr:MAG: FAD-binding oxidoreductase [Sphingobacteriales bacterium]
MDVDYLIVGHGIAGTLLSYELMRQGSSVIVIDNEDPQRSSLVAGAVINPMAGKHWMPSKDAAVLIPQAIETYTEMGRLLHASFLSPIDLQVYHQTEGERDAFTLKCGQFPEQMSLMSPEQQAESGFADLAGAGVINGLWLVQSSELLAAWKDYLIKNKSFLSGSFDQQALQVGAYHIRYQDIKAGNIIFCEGAVAMHNPLFTKLPFTQNRGEALLLAIPGLSQQHIYHRKYRLIPKGDDLFWYGSNYKWNSPDLEPDETWRAEAWAELASWMKLPFSLKAHIEARRPTTAGQMPFIGRHPQFPAVSIFNGLGTRGFSAGPYWAKAFAAVLQGRETAISGYNQERFSRFFNTP